MKKKKWVIKHQGTISQTSDSASEIVAILLENRGLLSPEERNAFLTPKDPELLTADDLGIDSQELEAAVGRIQLAIEGKESIIVYSDYDADGVTAGAIMWETLYALGANVLPYIPHRIEEGYGLSTIGIDTVKREHNASLIVTVDHGITAYEKVEYAKELGIDVMVTDHHTKPEVLPDTTIIHTTAISGAGVSWFVAKTLLEELKDMLVRPVVQDDLLALATIGIIADLLPLAGPNRQIVHKGLRALSVTKRVGLRTLMKESGVIQEKVGMYDISHVIAPRINALGRLEHALDALRLLCTTSEQKALLLSQRIQSVNKDRQQLTVDTALHAMDAVKSSDALSQKKILIITDEIYNQGIIGLAAGRLVEEFYLPAIVLSKGEKISKASARSIAGFNIIEAIRSASDLLVDVGGHPMAAGFTIETHQIAAFQTRLEAYAEEKITEDMLARTVTADLEVPLSLLNEQVFQAIESLAPFGMGNPQPLFVSRKLKVFDSRVVGREGKHVQLRLVPERGGYPISAIAFGMGEMLPEIQQSPNIDLVYSIEMNEWNGKRSLQLKVKDIQVS